MNILLDAILVILIVYDIYVATVLNKHEAAIIALLQEHPQLLAGDDEDGI